MALPQRLREKLSLPVFAAPMFLCSSVELAIACCKAGIIGSLTRNHYGVVVMAGAISNGVAIRAAEILGADLAYMGTRFIATEEASAPGAYKTMLVEGNVTDVIYTQGVNGLPASWLKASLRSIGLDPDNLFIPEGRSTDHLPEDKKPWRDIWSGGQGIGLIHDIPKVTELVQRLQREYIAACEVPNMANAARAALGG